jgi:hypothetical protein
MVVMNNQLVRTCENAVMACLYCPTLCLETIETHKMVSVVANTHIGRGSQI